MNWRDMSKELAKAFMVYGMHKESCSRRYGGGKCDCGLESFKVLCEEIVRGGASLK